jgi:ketosteroid isomerase-like protein
MTTTSEIMTAYADAVDRHDLAAIDALHSFGARIDGPRTGYDVAALLASFTNWFALVPDVKTEIRAYAENGPVAFVEVTLAGTDTDGNPVARTLVLVVETEDGLIVDERQYVAARSD